MARDHVDHYGYPCGRGDRDFSSSDLVSLRGSRSAAPAAQRWEFLRQIYGPQDASHQEAATAGDTENRTEPAGGIKRSDDMQWISVEERLPDDGLTVLVAVPGASEPVWLGYYEDRWYWENAEYVRENVTHWMPLPELPR